MGLVHGHHQPNRFSQGVSQAEELCIGVGLVLATMIETGGPSDEHNENDRELSMLDLDWNFLKNNRLFGRDDEVDTLQKAFQRRIAPDSRPEFILLSGKGGTGKTALARELRNHVTPKGGYFLMAKFDQLQKPRPYSAFVSAFTEFVRILLTRGPKPIADVKEAVLNAVGLDSRLLIDMIPALEKILGAQEPIVAKGIKAHTRLQIAVCNLVRAIGVLKYPLVLVMDDLQWADSESLEMLEVLVSDERIQGLLAVGICRSNEVSFDHHFAAMLRRLEDENKTLITHIVVCALTPKAIRTMLSSVLNLEEEKCVLMAAFLFARTEGNAFFLLQMLQEIYIDGILEHNCQCDKWVWDESRLSNFKKVENVVDLLSRRIKRLPDDMQTVLMAAACLGAEFSCELLSKAMVKSNVEKVLTTALHKNILLYDAGNDTYAFRHDKVQQAAYSLIDESKRALVHVSIGRQLLKNISQEELSPSAFLIVNQMMRGLSLLEDEKEKNDLAHVCLKAGTKAMLSSDFKTAAIHFWHGITFCGKRCWQSDHYDLSLELYNAVAEAECVNANFQQMNKAVEAVLSNALVFIDKIKVYSTQVYAYFACNQVQEAIDLGLFVLDCLGEAFPSEIEENTILSEQEKARALLYRKTDADLLKIPDIINREKSAAITILNLLTTYTLAARPDLFSLIVARFVILSVNHGYGACSPCGFAAYGIVCCRVGDWENGYRYGELALSLLERYDESGKEWVSRVMAYYGFIAPFRRPVSSLKLHLLEGEKIGMKTGDVESAGYAALLYIFYSFFSGVPLHEIHEKLDLLVERFEKYNQSFHTSALFPDLQAVHSFMGMSGGRWVVSGKVFNEKEEIETATSQNKVIFLSRYLIRKLMFAYHFDDLERALDIAKETEQYEKDNDQLIVKIDSYFYRGLAYVAAARATNTKDHLPEAHKNLDKLVFISDSCPKNCMHKVLLLEAEFASLRVNKVNIEDKLLPKYDHAVELARDECFLHDQALACERAGWALWNYGKESRAVTYFTNAIDLYKQWGATAKVNHMLTHCHGVQST